MTPFLCVPFEREIEQPTGNAIQVDIMPITETRKGKCVPEQGIFVITIEHIFGQFIYNAHRHFKINKERETCRGYDFNRSHEICAEIQNKLQGLKFSFGPPSSTINVDDVGPSNIQGNSPI